jgi:hypothetical protein
LPAALGECIDGWRVCWQGGWDKCRILFVVMVERPLRTTSLLFVHKVYGELGTSRSWRNWPQTRTVDAHVPVRVWRFKLDLVHPAATRTAGPKQACPNLIIECSYHHGLLCEKSHHLSGRTFHAREVGRAGFPVIFSTRASIATPLAIKHAPAWLISFSRHRCARRTRCGCRPPRGAPPRSPCRSSRSPRNRLRRSSAASKACSAVHARFRALFNASTNRRSSS